MKQKRYDKNGEDSRMVGKTTKSMNSRYLEVSDNFNWRKAVSEIETDGEPREYSHSGR